MRRRRIALFLHRWHRRIGVGVCIFILWIVSSGWLLNHSDSLHLAQTQSHALPLLNWYGLKSEAPTTAWTTAHHWLVAGTDVLVLDGSPLTVAPLQIIGAVEIKTESGEWLFVAGNSREGAATLLLLAPTGAVVDTVQGAQLPLANIARIGSGCGGVVIDNSTQQFASNDGANWNSCGEVASWSDSTPIDARQRDIVEPLVRPGIAYERLLLDLHSGRFFGSWGPYFVDAIGAGLMLLALSGLWMFSNQRRQRREPHRRRPHHRTPH